jgi:hypothetical protein
VLGSDVLTSNKEKRGDFAGDISVVLRFKSQLPQNVDYGVPPGF